jgi:hypothetical protein
MARIVRPASFVLVFGKSGPLQGQELSLARETSVSPR